MAHGSRVIFSVARRPWGWNSPGTGLMWLAVLAGATGR
jgi:hypothetical protein